MSCPTIWPGGPGFNGEGQPSNKGWQAGARNPSAAADGSPFAAFYQRFHLQPPYGPRCLRGPHPPRAGTICALAAFATVSLEAMGIANAISGKTRQHINEAMTAILRMSASFLRRRNDAAAKLSQPRRDCKPNLSLSACKSEILRTQDRSLRRERLLNLFPSWWRNDVSTRSSAGCGSRA